MSAEENNNGLLTTTLLARLLGLTEQRVRDMAKEGIITTTKMKGNIRYFAFSAVTQYCEYIRSVMEKRNPTTLDEQKLRAEVKYKSAKARKAELEANELEGKMHNSEDVEVVYNLLVYSARNMLEAFPARTASLCVGKKTVSEIQAVLEEEARRCMLELRNVDYTHEDFKKVIDKIMRERIGKEEKREDEDNESS